jgi:hypothetical protein
MGAAWFNCIGPKVDIHSILFLGTRERVQKVDNCFFFSCLCVPDQDQGLLVRTKSNRSKQTF